MLKFRTLFILLLFISGLTAVKAQSDADLQKRQFDQPSRPQLLRELGLTPPQIRQIRNINIENREKLREANFRLREARRNMDAAIYSDNTTDESFSSALREFQDAQAEAAKIKAVTEFEIRKVLSPEQLIRFREIRQKFEQMNDNHQNRRQEHFENFPNRRIGNQKKPPLRN